MRIASRILFAWSTRGAVMLFALLCAVTALPVRSRADDSALVEYKVKAVCLYNFAKYVKWPEASFPTPQTPIKLCVLGNNPFGDLFKDVAGKTVQDRQLELVYLATASKAAELSACHILFTTAAEDSKYGALVDSLKDSNVLTVTEVPERGIVGFFLQEGKVRFSISLAKATDAAITISSQLLRLAKVRDDDTSH